MTETEWLACSDPGAMLEHARRSVSPRKLRWFACACVRGVWDMLLDASSQLAVEVAERFADAAASVEELLAAEQEAFAVAGAADLRMTASDPSWAATRAAARAARLDAFSAASGAALYVTQCAAPWEFTAAGDVAHHGNSLAKARSREALCGLLREIVGNPFREVAFDPRWRQWDGGIVARLARELYDDARFDELPVLADALEEAGCDLPDLLDHFRRRGRHTRGCWALDLVLGLR